MTRNLACSPIAKKVLPALAKLTGRRIDAITLGDLTLVFRKDMTPEEEVRLARHEAEHRAQSALHTPVWGRTWIPGLKHAGKVVASARFLATYLEIWLDLRKAGDADAYRNHPLEQAARNAEDGK